MPVRFALLNGSHKDRAPQCLFLNHSNKEDWPVFNKYIFFFPLSKSGLHASAHICTWSTGSFYLMKAIRFDELGSTRGRVGIKENLCDKLK